MLKIRKSWKTSKIELVLSPPKKRFSKDLLVGLCIALCFHLGGFFLFHFKRTSQIDAHPPLISSYVDVILTGKPPELGSGMLSALPPPRLPAFPALPAATPYFFFPLEDHALNEPAFESIEKIPYEPFHD